MNKILCGDSRELLKQMQEVTVDAVYFDPPFNSNRKYRLHTSSDLGFDDIWKDNDEYISLVEPIMVECKRLLKKNGSFFLQ